MERSKKNGMVIINFNDTNVTFILVLGMVPDERIKVLAEPLMWFYLAMTSVIGTYMGVTTYASLKAK